MSKEIRLEVYNKFKGRCSYCGEPIEYKKMQVDHFNPLYRGYTDKELEGYNITRGTNDKENLFPSCATCNLSKSTFTIEQWREQLMLKIERLRVSNTNFRLLEKFNIIEYTNKEVVFYFEKLK